MVCYNNYYRPTMERSYMNSNSSGYSAASPAAPNMTSPCGGEVFGCIVNLIIILVVLQFLTQILCCTTCDAC